MLSWASREFVAQSLKANEGGYFRDTVQCDGESVLILMLLNC